VARQCVGPAGRGHPVAAPRGMDAPTRVFLLAATLVTLAFSSPLLRPDVLQRLALIAYVPGMIPIVYLICRETSATAVVARSRWRRRRCASPPSCPRPRGTHALRVSPAPRAVIVITRHLLRWWVAWTMGTRFSTRVEPALAQRDAYDAVLVLDEIRGGAFGVAPGPPGIGGRAVGVRDAARSAPRSWGR